MLDNTEDLVLRLDDWLRTSAALQLWWEFLVRRSPEEATAADSILGHVHLPDHSWRPRSPSWMAAQTHLDHSVSSVREHYPKGSALCPPSLMPLVEVPPAVPPATPPRKVLTVDAATAEEPAAGPVETWQVQGLLHTPAPTLPPCPADVIRLCQPFHLYVTSGD